MKLRICILCKRFHYDGTNRFCYNCGFPLGGSIDVTNYIHLWEHNCGNVLYMHEDGCRQEYCKYCGKKVTLKDSKIIDKTIPDTDLFHGTGGTCLKCLQRRPWGDYCYTCGQKLEKRQVEVHCGKCNSPFTIELTRDLPKHCEECGSSQKSIIYRSVLYGKL